MSDDPSTLRTSISLILRVRDWEDAGGWKRFYELYRRLVRSYALRSGLSHAEADDVVQDVFKRVAETIHTFDPARENGSFRGWLLQLARWRITDQFRRRDKAGRGGSALPGEDDAAGRTRMIERVPQPGNTDEIWDREWQTHLLETARQRLARRVQPEHFEVFDLYVCRNQPVAEVGARFGMTPARVYLIGHRMTRQLKQEVEKLQQQLS